MILIKGMAGRLVDQRDTVRGMPLIRFAILGGHATGRVIEALIRNDLGIADADGTEEVEQTLTARIAEPLQLPDDMAAGIANTRIAAEDVALARHIGFDPLRLLVSAAEGIARIDDGERSYRVIPHFKDRQIDKIDIAFRVATGTIWRRGTLTVEKSGMPIALATAMRGRMMADVLGHDWPGWEKMPIEESGVTNGKLTVKTGTRTMVPLATA